MPFEGCIRRDDELPGDVGIHAMHGTDTEDGVYGSIVKVSPPSTSDHIKLSASSLDQSSTSAPS
jgi:hypothetical protein